MRILKNILAVKESLYSTITPIMKSIIEILGSDREDYLSRLNSENAKHDMRDIYQNYKNMNRKRVDRTLDHLQNTVVNTLLSLLQQLDQVFLESQNNSNLLLQLLEYFSKYWHRSISPRTYLNGILTLLIVVNSTEGYIVNSLY